MVRARILRDVGVAEQKRLIAGLARLGREVRLVMRQGGAVADRPVVHRILPGQKGRPCRTAGVRDRIVVAKGHAICGKRMNVGHHGMTGQRAPKTVGPQLIDHHEQDIFRLSHRASPAF